MNQCCHQSVLQQAAILRIDRAWLLKMPGFTPRRAERTLSFALLGLEKQHRPWKPGTWALKAALTSVQLPGACVQLYVAIAFCSSVELTYQDWISSDLHDEVAESANPRTPSSYIM